MRKVAAPDNLHQDLAQPALRHDLDVLLGPRLAKPHRFHSLWRIPLGSPLLHPPVLVAADALGDVVPFIQGAHGVGDVGPVFLLVEFENDNAAAVPARLVDDEDSVVVGLLGAKEGGWRDGRYRALERVQRATWFGNTRRDTGGRSSGQWRADRGRGRTPLIQDSA
jgi:hypothetical protein